MPLPRGSLSQRGSLFQENDPGATFAWMRSCMTGVAPSLCRSSERAVASGACHIPYFNMVIITRIIRAQPTDTLTKMNVESYHTDILHVLNK